MIFYVFFNNKWISATSMRITFFYGVVIFKKNLNIFIIDILHLECVFSMLIGWFYINSMRILLYFFDSVVVFSKNIFFNWCDYREYIFSILTEWFHTNSMTILWAFMADGIPDIMRRSTEDDGLIFSSKALCNYIHFFARTLTFP